MEIRLPNSNESIIGYDTLQTDEVNGTKNDFTTKINQLLNWMGLVKDYVIETGSNVNGNWEKWNSGKLVQWGLVAITTSSKIATFPKPFINSNYIVIGLTLDSTQAYDRSPSVQRSTGNYMTIHIFNAPSSVGVHYKTVGRWK